MSRRRKNPRQQRQQQQQGGITRLQIGVVAGIAIIMVIAFVVFNQGAGGQEAAPTVSTSQQPAAEQGTVAGIDLNTLPTSRTEDGDPVLGAADAPVTIVEYSDYQCPHCASFVLSTFPEIVKNYVTSGQVRYVHKNAAILGEESQWAAMAAFCAADQDHFWEYHEDLFNHQNGENQGAFSRDNLKQFAADLGLNTDDFNQCLDDNKYSQKVVDEAQQAKQVGVTGTPSFLVDSELVVGNQPFDAMKKVIDKHLEGTS